MHVSKVIVRGVTIKNGLEISEALEGGGTGLEKGLGLIFHDWNACRVQASRQGGQVGGRGWSWSWSRSRSRSSTGRKRHIISLAVAAMRGGGVHVSSLGVTATVATELGHNCSIDSDGMLSFIWDVLGLRKV